MSLKSKTNSIPGGEYMKCPKCGTRSKVELDIHSEGYTPKESPVKECGSCGTVWRIVDGGEVDIIKNGLA